MVLGRSRSSWVWRTGLFAAGSFAAPALAQQAPPLPTPEQIEPVPPEPAAPGNVHIDSSGGIERQACALEDSPLTLDISSIRFVAPGGGPLAPEIAQSLAGVSQASGTQPIRVLCDLRDRANAALRADGWVASVQIPPQQITTGEVSLVVVTAKIVEVRVRGSGGPYEDLLRGRIEALKAMDPLNERDAERLLLLANDVPGLEISMALSPAGTAPGEVIGDLNVRYSRFAVLFNSQNYNSKLLGRETGYVRLEAYGLTGMGDVTYIGGSSTYDFKEQRIIQGGHVMTLDDGGATLGLRATYAWSRPDLGALDYRTRTLVSGFDLTKHLVRSVKGDAVATVGFDYIDQKTSVRSGANTLPLTLDKLRVVFANVHGGWRELDFSGRPRWTIDGDLELRKGLDVFDATRPGFTGGVLQSRIDGEATAFVARGEVEAEVWPVPVFSLYGHALGQWTNDPLLNYEEFSLGNLTMGRGYDPGSNSGDRAFGLAGEIRADVPVNVGGVRTQVFGFYDHVWLDNLDPNATEVNRNLDSYGAGLRFTMPGKAHLEVTYAHPQDRVLRNPANPAPPPDRVLVSLSLRFRDRAR
jgi:hemolysin activation/secretion protein